MTRNLSIAELRAHQAPSKRRNKFGAVKVKHDGMTFDSKGQFARWQELRLLERAKEIHNLQHEPTFDLIVNGAIICKFQPDFLYFEGAQAVVEDFKQKSTITRAFSIKRKLFCALYPEFQFRIVGVARGQEI